MFEVLLQADRALASGDLDQAERSYWQLVELDPTNAIAVTGLARVSVERGDRRLARTLAVQALAIDPLSPTFPGARGDALMALGVRGTSHGYCILIDRISGTA